MPEEESKIAEKMFTSSKFMISGYNGSSLYSMQKNLRAFLNQKYENLYFVSNVDFMIYGIVLSILASLMLLVHINPDQSTLFAFNTINGVSDVIALFNPFNPFIIYGDVSIIKLYLLTVLFLCTFLTLWVAFVAGLICSFYNLVFKFETKYIITIILISICLIPISIGSSFYLYFLSRVFSFYALILLGALPNINFVFFILIRAPTTNGRSVIQQIDSFRLYLKSSNSSRAIQDNAPVLTPALFEKYLPYAIALDAVYEWCTQFEKAMKQAGLDINTYRPAWYTTSQASPQTLSSMLKDLVDGLENSISCATSAKTSDKS